MKKNYLFVAFLCSVATFAQGTFNNAAGAGNGKWGTLTNWTGLTGGVLPTTTATISANVDLDIAASLSTSITSASSTLITSSIGKLTITGTASGAGIISSGANFIFNGLAEINTGSATAVKFLQVNNTALEAPLVTPSRQLTFGPQSVLMLTTPARVITQVPTFSKVVFQGKIEGSGALQFNGTTEFATTATNATFAADMVFFSPSSTIIANNTTAGSFLKSGQKVQVNNTGCSLTLNGTNIMNGNLSLSSANGFTLNVNANQGSFGSILIGDQPLAINVNPSVTVLSFADSAANTWGTGTVNFIGYQTGEIRFGTNNTALTASQLAKITADGAATGQALALDANGFLVLASSLSTNPIDAEKEANISYPTMVTDLIYFSKPQNKIAMFNVNGTKVFTASSNNGLNSVTTAELSSGIYFIVFDGVKVEKFIKK